MGRKIDVNGLYTQEDVKNLRRIAAKQSRIFESAPKGTRPKYLNRYDYFMMGGMKFSLAETIIYYAQVNHEITGEQFSILKRLLLFHESFKAIKNYEKFMHWY